MTNNTWHIKKVDGLYRVFFGTKVMKTFGSLKFAKQFLTEQVEFENA